MFRDVEAFALDFVGDAQPEDHIDDLVEDQRSDARP